MANELGIQEIGGEISLHDIIHFDFTNTTSVNIEDIIIHLQGLEKVSRKVPEILDKLVSECKLDSKVYFRYSSLGIRKLDTGSIFDFIDLKLQILFSGEADPKTKQKVMEDIKRMSPSWKIATLIGMIAVGAIGAKCCSAQDQNISGLQQMFSLNIGTSFNIAPEKVLPIIQNSAKKATTGDVKAALELIKPAKKSGGNINLAEGESLFKIPESLIAATPDNYNPPAIIEHTEIRKDIDIQIRALDMDNPEKGWYAIIPDVLPNRHRLKLELADGIDTMKLSALNIKGDVEVTYKVKPDGTKKAYKVLLLELK